MQTQFVVDEVSNIIKESIENTIGGNGYAHAKVSQWTNAVVESCLASLTKLQKPFKYIGKRFWNGFHGVQNNSIWHLSTYLL